MESSIMTRELYIVLVMHDTTETKNPGSPCASVTREGTGEYRGGPAFYIEYGIPAGPLEKPLQCAPASNEDDQGYR